MMAIPGPASALAADDLMVQAQEFLAEQQKTLVPLEIECAKLSWTAMVTGREEDFKAKEEAEKRIVQIGADPERFARVKRLHEASLPDPIVRRQIELHYLGALSKQVDKELLDRIVASSNRVERLFAITRPEIDGVEVTDNRVREILRKSTDSAERQKAWEAGKRVGRVVEAELKELVKLRNEAARKLGFENYQAMRLKLGEQEPEVILKLFDELDELTREPFRQAKAKIDAELARRVGVNVPDLRPWHYHDPFFQEAPAIATDEYDELFKEIKIPEFCAEYYAGIGLPVQDVLERSDLYEKPGKNPHAFCTDIDRRGDVRVLANVVPGREWLSTMLHELGHAVYSSKNIPASLPYEVRTDAHALNTEGIAMMFERFLDEARWLAACGVEVPDPEKYTAAAQERRRHRLLIFSRWCQVMFRFEKALYENPDQDLNRLWWDLVEEYQEVKRPEGRNAPDYAAKIHVVTVPVYYHNYMMGEMFASQVVAAMRREVLGENGVCADNPKVGEFLKERVFAPGATLPWNELTQHATGETLSAKAFAREIGARGDAAASR